MATKKDLADWVYQALKANGGSASLVDVAKHIWTYHETDLKAAGDLFYTWQYDMRWAATELRRQDKIQMPNMLPKGMWALK